MRVTGLAALAVLAALALGQPALARCAAPGHYDDALGALFRGQMIYLQSGNVDGWLIPAATSD